MRELTLDDFSLVEVGRVSGSQLSVELDADAGASRERPLLLRVIAVDGKPILPSHLVVTDTNGIWLTHQAEVIPRSTGAPEIATGLSPAEAILARELFLSLVAEENSVTSADDRKTRTRERVLARARQIEALSHPETDEGTFFREFLKLLLEAVGATAGVIWLKEEGGRVIPRVEHRLNLTGYRNNANADQTNAKLLTEVFQTGQSKTFGGGERTDLPIPTNHLYVICPILKGTDCVGVVEVMQRPDVDPRARPGYLNFIEHMCGYAARYLKYRERGL